MTNKTATFAQLCNTAILRSGIANVHGIRDALTRLVVTLIEQKDYDSFTQEQLIHDFDEFYKLHITSIMLGDILPELRRQSLVSRIDKTHYSVNKKSVAKLNLLKGFDDFIRQRDLLVSEFMKYLQPSIGPVSKSDAERILSVYVEKSICALGIEVFLYERLTDEEEYLVASFIGEIKKNQPEFYSVFEEILVGRMLASFITGGGKSSGGTKSAFGKMSIYLDSAFIFNLLGLNNYSTPTEYRELIGTLRGMGAKLKVFWHTFNEIYDIIYSSMRWIGNYGYSLERTSRVNEFFLNNKSSREDVEEYLHTLESKLNGFGIFVEEADIEYGENDTLFQADIKKDIIDEYQKSGTYNEEKDLTYDLDAKSLYAIHQLRRKKSYHRFEDVGSLFLTTNQAIARVARRIARNASENGSIPLAFTDTFLSVLLFFTCPDYSGATNERFCIPAAFHAFEPGKGLVRKVEQVLGDIQEKGLITQADLFSWKTSTVLSNYIVHETNNNPDNFNEDTPDKIFELIQEEADRKVTEAKAKSEHDIKVARQEADEYVDQMQLEAEKAIIKERKEKTDALVLLDEARKEKKRFADELIAQHEKEKEALVAELASITKGIEKKATIIGWIITIIAFALATVAVATAQWLSDFLKGSNKTYFVWLSYLLGAFLAVAAFASIPPFLGNRLKNRIIISGQKKNSPRIERITAEIEKLDNAINALSAE